MACSFDIDVLCEGEVVGSDQMLLLDSYSEGILWRFSGIDPATHRVKKGSTSLFPAPARLVPEFLAARGWELRLRSTAENVLRDWGADRRWVGTVHIPLAEVASD